MKTLIIVIALFSTVSVFTNAQNQTTRFEKQHHIRYLKEHLKLIDTNLLKSLSSNNPDILASTAQTIRSLEQIFPEDDFSQFIAPLSKLVQSEEAKTRVRLLSALALDLMHSDEGDAAIYYAAKYTNNNSVKDLCNCLATENIKGNIAEKSVN